MVLHRALTDTALQPQTTRPTATPSFVGELWAVATSDLKAVWMATGTSAASDWVVIGSSTTERAGSPNGNVQVSYGGQLIYDTTNDTLWIGLAANIGLTSWSQISAPSGGY